jgi:hypothetical protein
MFRPGNHEEYGAKAVMLTGALLICLMLFAAGCATTDSDMPWNAPQSWEGSPYIPGLSGEGF